MSKVKGESRELFEWVKASEETPPEGRLLNLNLIPGGPALGHYRKTYDSIDAEKYGEIERKDFSIVEWLKPIPQSSLKEETDLLRMFKGIDIIDRTETYGFLFIDKENKYWIITPKNTTGFFHADEVEPKSVEQIASLTPKSIRDSVEEIETLRIAAWDGWLGAANAYRSYPDQKHTFTDYWTSLGEVKAKALIKSASLNPNKLSDSLDIEKTAEEYAERVCNGGFPIEYTREQVVKHTKDDFIAGANFIKNKL